MADDLFSWIDAIWNKTQPTGTFPAWVAHRFLASDPDFAQVARVLGREVKEPDLVFRTWQGLLGKDLRGPRLTYPAPKKRPEAEELVLRIMKSTGERRWNAEAMVEIVTAAGKLLLLYREFGVQPPAQLVTDELDEPKKKRKDKKVAAKDAGLLGMI